MCERRGTCEGIISFVHQVLQNSYAGHENDLVAKIHPERHKAKFFEKRKEEKEEEREKTNCNAKKLLDWQPMIIKKKKKLLLSNYLEQNYAQVLQFQSKVLCQEKKKNGMKPEWTIAIQKNKLN